MTFEKYKPGPTIPLLKAHHTQNPSALTLQAAAQSFPSHANIISRYAPFSHCVPQGQGLFSLSDMPNTRST